MNISTHSTRPNLVWLHVFVLLCAIMVVPIGFTHAYDFSTVEIAQDDTRKRQVDPREFVSENERSKMTDRRLLHYLFEQVDMDKNESLSRNEINLALQTRDEKLVRLLSALRNFFEAFDDDSNGELSKRECYGILKRLEERERAKRTRRLLAYLFEQVDLDRSEGLGLWEINAALQAGNERLAKLLSILQKYFVKIDRSEDGELSRRECYGILLRLDKKAENMSRLVRYLFGKVDSDKSGSLSLNEINSAVPRENEKMAKLLIELQQAFVRVDRNGDGELSRRECYGFLETNNRSERS